MLYEFKGHRPVVDPSSFVHPQAAVTGNVIIGKQVYIGPGAAIRGDWGQIVIEDGCNVQENCTIHMFPGVTVTLKEGAHIGHGAIVHGATIGRNCLIGMNAVVMDGVIVGDECIVGALSFLKAETVIPARSVVVGNPGRVVKQVSDEMLDWKTEGTAIYQRLPQDMQENWKACEAGQPGNGDQQSSETGPVWDKAEMDYKPWKETQTQVEEPATAYGYGRRTYTMEEYLHLEQTSQDKHEYHKGEIYLMSGVRVDHNTIHMTLIIKLGPMLRSRSCDIFSGDLRVYVEAEELITYPDLTIVCCEPLFRTDSLTELINPGVIIEILSPSTREYDRGDKFRFYQSQPTLREYILVDSQSVLVEHFTKNGETWTLQKYDKLGDTLRIGMVDAAISLKDIYEKVRFLNVAR
jgi:phenylacetic acid degradation protein